VGVGNRQRLLGVVVVDASALGTAGTGTGAASGSGRVALALACAAGWSHPVTSSDVANDQCQLRLAATGAPQTVTVPSGVHSLVIQAVGGRGGASVTHPVPAVCIASPFGAAEGIREQGTIGVTPGEMLRVDVGGNGTAGSEATPGAGRHGGGSGASNIEGYGWQSSNTPGRGSGGGGGGAVRSSTTTPTRCCSAAEAVAVAVSRSRPATVATAPDPGRQRRFDPRLPRQAAPRRRTLRSRSTND
jgi:hypothetical protein